MAQQGFPGTIEVKGTGRATLLGPIVSWGRATFTKYACVCVSVWKNHIHPRMCPSDCLSSSLLILKVRIPASSHASPSFRPKLQAGVRMARSPPQRSGRGWRTVFVAPRWGQAVGAGGSPDDVCVKECDPHAAVHQSLPSTEQPHVRPTDGRHLAATREKPRGSHLLAR